MPLPRGLSAKNRVLKDLFAKSGPTETAAACSAALSVPVDFYWTQSGDSFADAVNLCGGLDGTFPKKIEAYVPQGVQVSIGKGAQHLNGVQAEAAVCYAAFATQKERFSAEGAVFQALFEKLCAGPYLDPDVFGDAFEMAKTSFSMADLVDDRPFLRQAAGRVNVFLPQTDDAGDRLSASSLARIQKLLGRQNRQYAP